MQEFEHAVDIRGRLALIAEQALAAPSVVAYTGIELRYVPVEVLSDRELFAIIRGGQPLEETDVSRIAATITSSLNQ